MGFPKLKILINLDIPQNTMKRTVHNVELPLDFAQRLLDN
jgi:hypothetical protein